MYVMDVRMITPLNRANYSKCPKISSYAPTTTQLTHARPTIHLRMIYTYIYISYVSTLTNLKEIFLNSQSKIPSQNHILLMNTFHLITTFRL